MRKRSEKFESEVELAAVVCAWLDAAGWEVFKEVFTYDGEIDIVARWPSTGLLWGIECKLRMSNELIEQAHKRLLSVHQVSVAAQMRNGDEIAFVQEDFLDRYGIGAIAVSKPSQWHWKAEEELPPASIEEVKRPKLIRPHDLGGIHSPNRWRSDSKKPNVVRLAKGIKTTRSFLMDATKQTIAGAPGGGQFTPWKRTVVLLKEFLAKKGRANIKEIIAEIDHHYRSGSSARNGITAIMGQFEKQHFEMIREGKEVYWQLRTANSSSHKEP